MSRFSKITQQAPLSKAVLCVSLGLFFGTAQAAPISDLLFEGELNQLSDNSGENLNVDNFDGITNLQGRLDVGDTLRGTLEIETIEDLSGGGGTNATGGANNELTAVFETVVTSATLVSDGGTPADPTDDVFNFTFGPYAPFAAECNNIVGTIACFYEDTVTNYDRTGTVANAEATATDGSIVWAIGMDGSDADEAWVATGPAFPGAAALVPAGTAVGTFAFQLSTLFEDFDVDFEQVLAGIPVMAGDGLIDVNASGSILGTNGATSDYDVFDNVDFTVRVATPVSEPGALSLLGLGLLGFASLRMRRRKS